MTPSKVGTIIKEYLNARNITQKDVCLKTGISERHFSNVVNGKQLLSYHTALLLEKVMPDVKAEFWIAIENQYQLFKLRKILRYGDLFFNEDSEEEYEGEFEELEKYIKQQGWFKLKEKK